MVYPSGFLRDRHLELFPGLAAGPAPGDRARRPAAPGVRRSAGEGPARHVAYIGSVLPHKGALVFEEVVRELPAEKPIRTSVERLRRRRRGLLHSPAPAPPRAGARLLPPGSLVDVLRRDRVDLALLLSIVPESYSLALSECLAAGVPVVAFDHGAIAERVRRHGGGLLVEPRDRGGGDRPAWRPR